MPGEVAEVVEEKQEFNLGVAGKIDVPGEYEEPAEEEEKTEGEAKVDEEVKEGEVSKEDEVAFLRQIARDQKRKLDLLASQVADATKKLEEAQIITPEEVEQRKEQERAAGQRMEQLENFLEVMRVSPAFEDVDDVCSQSRVDDLVSALAKAYLKDNPAVSLEDAEKGISSEIWSMRNPYRFLYKNIKQYHPDFIKKEEEKIVEKAAKKLSAEKIAGSLQNAPGGASGDVGGWTSAKIDSLSEEELGKVPKDVYMDYMRGILK